MLLQWLLQAGAARGARQFRAFVLADNQRMNQVLRRVADIGDTTVEAGVVELRLMQRPGTAAPAV